MGMPYNNTGLSPEQIINLDSLCEYTQDLAAREPIGNTGGAYEFNVLVAKILEESGVDLDDPRSFAAAITGATILQDFMEKALPNKPIVRDTGSLVIGAMLAARPLSFE